MGASIPDPEPVSERTGYAVYYVPSTGAKCTEKHAQIQRVCCIAGLTSAGRGGGAPAPVPRARRHVGAAGGQFVAAVAEDDARAVLVEAGRLDAAVRRRRRLRAVHCNVRGSP